MIFAEMEYLGGYSEIHEELRAFLCEHFSQVKFGLQGDSWFWIFDGGVKVAIDSFTSRKHQVKSEEPGQHVQIVIQALQLKYKIKVYEKPELEGHEDE